MPEQAPTLTPPEVLTPIQAQAAPDVAPLAPEAIARAETQVQAFMQGLLTEDLQNDAFRASLDAAFRLGSAAGTWR